MVIISFHDNRRVNAPGREVRLQLQYLNEGVGYDLTLRELKYRDLDEDNLNKVCIEAGSTSLSEI